MKKSLRFISLLIAVVFMISGAVMVICHADEGDGQTAATRAVRPAAAIKAARAAAA